MSSSINILNVVFSHNSLSNVAKVIENMYE